MPDTKTFTLPKQEWLCSKTLIDHLFLDRSHTKKNWPVKVVYQLGKRKDEHDPQVEILVSVSKRHFKRAVKRNRVKRQLREAYRLHKSIVWEVLAKSPEAKLLIAFLWMEDKLHTSSHVESAVENALVKVAHHVTELLEETRQ